MKWWQIRKRDADLERELESDLELEEEEQRERGLSQKRPAMPPCALSAIQPLFASRLTLSGAGTWWRISFEI